MLGHSSFQYFPVDLKILRIFALPIDVAFAFIFLRLFCEHVLCITKSLVLSSELRFIDSVALTNSFR